jgi:hypothetical protein
VTDAPLPRWLLLAMVPILSAAAFCLDFEVKSRLARNAMAAGFDDASRLLVGVGQLVGPLLAAALVAYPIARFYEANWKLACVGVLLPIALFYGITYFDPDDLFGTIVMLMMPVILAIAVAAGAGLANFARRGSRLVVLADDAAPAGPARPLALQLVLLPIFVVAMFLLHDQVQPLVQDLGFLPTTPTAERVGMMIAAVVGPALLALAVGFPIARVYGRHALLVGALAPLLTLWWCRWMLTSYRLPLVGLAYAIELATLALLTPLLAWWVARRFHGTRLAIRRA